MLGGFGLCLRRFWVCVDVVADMWGLGICWLVLGLWWVGWGLYGDFSIGREGLRLYMKGFNVCRIGFR